MKLKKKILVLCIISFIIPLLMMIGIGGIIILKQINRLSTAYGVESSGLTVMQNPMIAYNSIVQDNMNKIKNDIEKNPEKIEDEKYLKTLNNSLSNYCAYVYVKSNGDYKFKGNESLVKDIDIYLPEYGTYKDMHGSIYISYNGLSVLIEQLDFEYKGKADSLYIVLDVDNFLPEVRKTARELVIVITLILILVLCVLVFLIHQLFISPITQLSKATHGIIEGDLDTPINSDRRDEIGQLQKDFEEMRVHLKESNDHQEENIQRSKEMMSNISHDLKTPLTAIKGYAEGLLDGVADTPEKQQKYIKTIYTKACFMEELVEDLSYFAKIDNKTVVYNFTKVPIKDFVLDCVEDLRMDMEIKGIRFMESYQFDENINVIIDPDEIKRVLKNIIGNAIKYMDKPEGEIRMRVLNDSEYVWIAIEDNGRGIATKDVSKIFDRFYRADSARGTKQGGTGLGLAIAKSIIEAHGGQVFADSVLGTGTVIRFSLPREVVVRSEKKEEQNNKKSKESKKK